MPKQKIFLILLLSILVQLSFMTIVKLPVERDAEFYDKVAQNISIGKGFTYDGVSPALNVKHLYVLVLAFIYTVFGHNIFMVKMFQVICVAFSCAVVFSIGKKVFNERIAFISGLVCSLYPPLFVTSSLLVSEALFTLLLLISIFLFIIAIKNDSMKWYIYAALMLGISIQVRPTPILFPVFMAVGLWFLNKDKKRITKIVLPILIIPWLMTLPWGIRNYICFHRFWPVDSIEAVWLGSFTKGEANQDHPESQNLLNKILKDSPGQGEARKIQLKLALDNVKGNFFGYLKLWPKKIIRLWTGSYSGLFNIGIPFSSFLKDINIVKYHPLIFLWKSALFILSLTIFLLAICGMIFSIKIWRDVLVLYLIIIYFTIFHMLLFANIRFGIPGLPYMILFAVFAVDNFYKKIFGGN